MELIATGAGKIISSASKSWSVTINGKSYSGTNSVAISNNTTKTLASGSVTIGHNTDGSKSFDYSFSQQFSITFAGESIGTKSGSGSGTLNTIPRASQPSLSATSVALGSAVTIYSNRASSSFTHTLSYKFGNSTGTIATGAGDNYTWTPALSLANQIPSATSGSCVITCQTYNGSTLIGTKTVNITLTVPSSVVPSISSIAISAGNSTVPSSWGVYVQGKSSLKVVTTASGSYSSSITSYKITGIDNNTYYSSNFTSGILQITGTRTITVTVTDSRGRTATKTTSYTCVAYSNPKITVATVTRCNSDGTANEEGTYVKYSFAANVAAVSNKNTYSYKIGYKNATSSSYTYITISNSAYSLNKSAVISGVTFSVDNSYDFQFYVGDYFSASTVVKNIGTGFTLLDFNASGKGFAVGKVSEGNKFEVDLPTELNDTTKLNMSSGDVYYHAKRTDSGTEIGFGVGSGGVNHGLWSFLLNKWMLYGDASKVYLNGDVNGNVNGTANRAKKLYSTSSGSDSSGTAGWYLVASRNMTGDWEDLSATLLVTQQYATGNVGILRIKCRRDQGDAYVQYFSWLTRYGWNKNDAYVKISGTQVNIYIYSNISQWCRVGVTVLEDAYRGGNGWLVLHNSTAPTTGLSGGTYPSDNMTFHPVGTVVIMSSNTNPSNYYGGTWELIDKEFSSGDNIGSFSRNTTNCSASDYDFSRAGHSLFFSGGFTVGVKWEDSDIHLGTIDFASCGVSRIGSDVYFVAYTDDGNSGLMAELEYNTGKIIIHDNFGDSYISAGRTGKWSCTVTVPMAYMNDSACNKFYWKRTA